MNFTICCAFREERMAGDWVGILLWLLFNAQPPPGPNASTGAGKSGTQSHARRKGPPGFSHWRASVSVPTDSTSQQGTGYLVPWCSLQGRNKCRKFSALKTSITWAGSTRIMLRPCSVHRAQLPARPWAARCGGQSQAGDPVP